MAFDSFPIDFASDEITNLSRPSLSRITGATTAIKGSIWCGPIPRADGWVAVVLTGAEPYAVAARVDSSVAIHSFPVRSFTTRRATIIVQRNRLGLHLPSFSLEEAAVLADTQSASPEGGVTLVDSPRIAAVHLAADLSTGSNLLLLG